MTCTTYETRCGTADGCREDGHKARRENGAGVLARFLSRLGEQLFHYRYVRAELIERALGRQDDERGAGR